MQFRKLDFWLWVAVILIVLGATTALLAVRWEPRVWNRPVVTEHSESQPRSMTEIL